MTSNRNRRLRRGLLLTAVLAVGAVVYVAVAALAAPSLAAPTVSSSPPNPSVSTSASFTFSGPSGASFECRLDAGAFASCSSPKSYTGLPVAAHTFHVRAVKGSQTSSETTVSWSVVAPAVSVTSGPTDPTSATSASFSFAPNAANAVVECRLDAAAFAVCSSPKSYSGVAQGLRVFQVRASGPNGSSTGTSSTVSWPFFVDPVKPNTPTLVVYPHDPASSRTSTFTWTDTDPGSPSTGTGIDHYLCSVENGSFFACSSGYTFDVSGPNNSQHQFAVEAVDKAGNVSSVATYKWKIVLGVAGPYTIGGNPSALLYPTTATVGSPINLTFSNPNSDTVQVNSLTVSVASVAAPNADSTHPCTTADFAVTQFTGTYPFYIPVGASSLQSLGFSSGQWPTVRLVDRPLNQDGCKGATVSLSYGGSS